MSRPHLPLTLSMDEQKTALKEALKEWMTEQFAAFGRFCAGAAVAALFTMLVYFYFVITGWHK